MIAQNESINDQCEVFFWCNAPNNVLSIVKVEDLFRGQKERSRGANASPLEAMRLINALHAII
jgi:hypothetical protein